MVVAQSIAWSFLQIVWLLYHRIQQIIGHFRNILGTFVMSLALIRQELEEYLNATTLSYAVKYAHTFDIQLYLNLKPLLIEAVSLSNLGSKLRPAHDGQLIRPKERVLTEILDLLSR